MPDYLPHADGELLLWLVNLKTQLPAHQAALGATAWTFLARDTKSPYDDFSPLEKPGVPENWEYQAVGVLGDDEAGQPSAVVRATFSG